MIERDTAPGLFLTNARRRADAIKGSKGGKYMYVIVWLFRQRDAAGSVGLPMPGK